MNLSVKNIIKNKVQKLQNRSKTRYFLRSKISNILKLKIFS